MNRNGVELNLARICCLHLEGDQLQQAESRQTKTQQRHIFPEKRGQTKTSSDTDVKPIFADMPF